MLKALLKKQLRELAAMWFRDRKTGKMRTGKSFFGMLVLWIFAFGSIAVAFYGMAALFAASFLPLGLDWLYFAMMGLLAIMIGVFGDVFNSYATLYLAKDNELLLSMPVKPSQILVSRMAGVYLMGLLYESLAFVPAIIAYWVNSLCKLSVVSVVIPLLNLFLTGLFVVVLTCILGYGVARISLKVKGKSLVTVSLSLLFLAGYYFVYFKLNTFLQEVASHANEVGLKIKNYAYPLYVFGKGCAGDTKSFIIIAVAVIAAAALIYFILSKTFIRIATASRAVNRTKNKKLSFDQSDTGTALLKREFRHLLASPTYMINCGLGVFIILAAAVALVIKGDTVNAAVAGILEEMPEYERLISPLIVMAAMLVGGMNNFTAPSVSLEGKSLWIIRSLPVPSRAVLEAKEKMHFLVNVFPLLIFVITASAVLKTGVAAAAAALVLICAFTVFTAKFGLIMNLIKPDLEWTNENVPVKQSLSVLFAMLTGFGVAVVFGLVSFFGTVFLPDVAILLLYALILAVAAVFMDRWIKTKGVARFETL